jgi:hypothetical protein
VEAPAPARSYIQLVDAPSPGNSSHTVQFGVRRETFMRFTKYGLKTSIAQFYDIVQNGLILAEHAFRGLNRPMMRGNDKNADESIVVYSWKPSYDSEWIGDPFSGKMLRLTPPNDRVFTVIV